MTEVLTTLTLRKAVGLIVAVATVLAVTASVLVKIVDPGIGTYGDALWWGVSTVSTVGYGDVVPTDGPGRIVATVLMLTGLALIPVITSVVVAILVGQSNREARERELAHMGQIIERLDRIEEQLAGR